VYAPVGCRDPVYNSAAYMWLSQKIGNWVTTDDWCIHTADATQLDSWVASASAVCIGLYLHLLHKSRCECETINKQQHDAVWWLQSTMKLFSKYSNACDNNIDNSEIMNRPSVSECLPGWTVRWAYWSDQLDQGFRVEGLEWWWTPAAPVFRCRRLLWGIPRRRPSKKFKLRLFYSAL